MIARGPLPIDAVTGEIAAGLVAPGSALVVVAPPGAGKTTVVPLVLLDQPWCAGRVLVTEPRRLAARSAAVRMTTLLGEKVGTTVGFRTRDETATSRHTRIEVITEGVLIRMLQTDPSLDGVDAIIFDEFHERSLDADLALAFTLDLRRHLLPDLRVLAMSATVDGSAVSALLDAEIVTCDQHVFPVTTEHLDIGDGFDARAVARAAIRAHGSVDGSTLVFVPGVGEVNKVVRAIGEFGGVARPLHGSLDLREQAQVIESAERTIVVATSIAETSVTIPDVRAVVDSGFSRVPRYDASRGVGSLATVPVSRASADQRRGRAGRTAAGLCIRLWPEHRRLADRTPPEIHSSDMVPLALELLRWGDPDGRNLVWLNSPDPGALAAARRLLASLSIVDAGGRLTDHGRACAELPLHPRHAHALLRAAELGWGALACDVIAALADADTRRGSVELDERLTRRPPLADRLRRRLHITEPVRDAERAGLIAALAFPDRIGRRRDGAAARFLLSGGQGAIVEAGALTRERWIVATELQSRGAADAVVRLGAGLDEADVLEHFADQITSETRAEWDLQARDVVAARETRFGAIVIATQPVDDGETARKALLTGLEREGLDLLPRWASTARWRARVAFCATYDSSGGWPDVSAEALWAGRDEWLVPALAGARRRRDLERVDVAEALATLLTWSQRQQMEHLAPTHLDLPTGRRTTIDYETERPTVSVRLQELLGVNAHPTIGGGRVPLTIELLSPAQRPIQVTADLPSFWRGNYAAVRKELRGRYPKHDWPEDPASASPSRRPTRRPAP